MSGSRTLRRLARILLVVAIPALPGFVFTVFGFAEASTVCTLGAVTALLAALTAGGRIALAAAVALSVATTLAVLVSDQPWLAMLVMGACAGAAGLMAGRGLSNAVIMAPITVGFMLAEPPTSFAASGPGIVNALVVGFVMLLAAVWGVLVGTLLGRKVAFPAAKATSRSRTVAYAATIAIAVGLAAWFVSDMELQHGGAWLMMTLLVVIQPYLQDTWTKSLQRAAGTVVGFAVALAIGLLITSDGIVFITGILFLVAGLYLRSNPHRPYWQYVAMLTPAVVLLEGASTSVVETDLTRLGYTLLGAAISLALTAAMLPYYRRQAARYSLTRY